MTQRGYGGPLRYVQGPGVLADLGVYIEPLAKSALIIIDGFFWDTLTPVIEESLGERGVTSHFVRFGGESTDAEVERCCAEGRAAQAGVVIGVGGGKALDTAKITAFNIGARIATVPTIASTDSPTSSIGVIYSADGVYDRVVRCGRNPDITLVDSALIIRAPVRFLVSGMGDALSTWYEDTQLSPIRFNKTIGTITDRIFERIFEC